MTTTVEPRRCYPANCCVEPRTIDLLKVRHPFQPVQGYLPEGPLIIGHGRILDDGTRLSMTEASALLDLRHLVSVIEAFLRKNLQARFTQGEYQAVISAAFDLGSHRLMQSSLWRCWEAGMYETVPDAFKGCRELSRYNLQTADLACRQGIALWTGKA